MHKSRRDFLRLAGRTCLISALASAGRARLLIGGRDHDTVSSPVLPRTVGVSVPRTAEPGSDNVLVRRIKTISNAFEIGRPEPNYAYANSKRL